MPNLIDRLKASRNSPAVLKIKLATLRSTMPTRIVFAFEGDTDKPIYYQWTKRARPDLVYEPFPCNGKDQVFGFRDMLDRDLGDLRRGVYFFIDRDFDDFAGHASDERTFMTDRYSVENYLLSQEVIEESLKDEFHCHAQPIVRAEVIAMYEKVLAEFHVATRDINFRLFVARKLPIPLGAPLPTKIKDVARVSLCEVQQIAKGVDQVVVLSREPSQQEINGFTDLFDALEPSVRYRGRFAFLFLSRWLDLLAEDRSQQAPTVFANVDKRRKVKIGEISSGILASRSPMPVGFAEFVAAVVH